MIKVEGPIAFVGKSTVDGRVIRGLDVSRQPIPILAIGDPEEPEGYLRAIGAIDDVQIQDGIVWATGQIEIEEFERCAVGIDMDSVVACHLLEGEAVGLDDLDWSALPENLIHEMSGRLVAVTVYVGGQNPAWPDAHLRRAECQ